MKLKNLLMDQMDTGKCRLIGRDIEILDEKVLVLGLIEMEDFDDEEGPEMVTKLMLLYEESHEEEWDEDEEDWDEEEETKTNRQVLIDLMEMDMEQDITDIGCFIINGQRYDVMTAEMHFMEERPYEEVMMLKQLEENGLIPSYWREKDLEFLSLAELQVDPSMFDVSWEADILSVSAELSVPEEEVLVGKVLECSCGHYDVPIEFSVKGRDGSEIPVKIQGVFTEDIWSSPECLDFDFFELEEICGRDQRLLVVEYSTREDLELNFYTKDYLDTQAYIDDDCEYDMLGISVIGPGGNQCVIDVVPQDFDGDVELELLSYTVVEDSISF